MYSGFSKVAKGVCANRRNSGSKIMGSITYLYELQCEVNTDLQSLGDIAWESDTNTVRIEDS